MQSGRQQPGVRSSELQGPDLSALQAKTGWNAGKCFLQGLLRLFASVLLRKSCAQR